MQQLDQTRASDAERDAAAERLQVAFAEGRLADTEFDQRMRSALTARTRADLAGILEDLPVGAPLARPGLAPSGGTARPGRLALSFKNSIRQAGRWRVPEHYTTVIYKGNALLDLRAAELTAPVTTIAAVAYKSTDYGKTWARLPSRPNPPYLPLGHVLAVGGTTPATLWMANVFGDKKVFKSIDGGLTFRLTGRVGWLRSGSRSSRPAGQTTR